MPSTASVHRFHSHFAFVCDIKFLYNLGVAIWDLALDSKLIDFALFGNLIPLVGVRHILIAKQMATSIFLPGLLFSLKL